VCSVQAGWVHIKMVENREKCGQMRKRGCQSRSQRCMHPGITRRLVASLSKGSSRRGQERAAGCVRGVFGLFPPPRARFLATVVVKDGRDKVFFTTVASSEPIDVGLGGISPRSHRPSADGRGSNGQAASWKSTRPSRSSPVSRLLLYVTVPVGPG
jgi:hypothetical protein